MGLAAAINPHGLWLLFSPTMTLSGWKLKQTTAAERLNSEWFGWWLLMILAINTLCTEGLF